ncbi:hypothetical protein BD410DRAFT_896719 [Rickenella mellea]|uniref:Late embryogenesis abundant protein LEA-2 subgroup domain-containing protein n=1 Tax=Rickenella mellea TaxID=50990 RepID=A0A4Y7QAW8_9AGAM|nr:hypothetical protein BD410DRAFT_896719 [Rickenella mellea]
MKFFTAPLSLLTLLAPLLVSNIGAGAVPAPALASTDANLPADILNLLNIGLVSQINVFISEDSFVTNIVTANFTVHNPLPVEITLDSVSAAAGIDGSVFSTFATSFKKFFVPPFSSKNSGLIQNVVLTQGIDAALGIVPLGVLDIIDGNVTIRGATIFGFGGIKVPLIGLVQKNISTSYEFVLS